MTDARIVAFTFVDGREVEASGPVALFEALRRTERVPPPNLDRYLDLLHSRALLGFGVQVDVGGADSDLPTRCRLALASMLNQGWIRLSCRTPSWARAPRR